MYYEKIKAGKEIDTYRTLKERRREVKLKR